MLDKLAILEERGNVCECGCGRTKQLDLHHWFFRSKNFPYFDCPEGVVLLDHTQNVAREFDNLKGRRFFWKIQCERFTEAHMLKWLEDMPSKIDRKRIDFLED